MCIRVEWKSHKQWILTGFDPYTCNNSSTTPPPLYYCIGRTPKRKKIVILWLDPPPHISDYVIFEWPLIWLYTVHCTLYIYSALECTFAGQDCKVVSSKLTLSTVCIQLHFSSGNFLAQAYVLTIVSTDFHSSSLSLSLSLFFSLCLLRSLLFPHFKDTQEADF